MFSTFDDTLKKPVRDKGRSSAVNRTYGAAPPTNDPSHGREITQNRNAGALLGNSIAFLYARNRFQRSGAYQVKACSLRQSVSPSSILVSIFIEVINRFL